MSGPLHVYMVWRVLPDERVMEGYAVMGPDEIAYPPTNGGLDAARQQTAEMNARYRAEREEEGKRTARVPRAKTTGTSPKGSARARRALWTERYGAQGNVKGPGTNDVSGTQE